MIEDLRREPHRQPVVAWLRSRGFIDVVGSCNMGIAWSDRGGHDFTDLEFFPLARQAEDIGWIAIIGHHASGTNPRMQIGTCETLEDVQMVYETIRLTNGYKEPEPHRGPHNENAKVNADRPPLDIPDPARRETP